MELPTWISFGVLALAFLLGWLFDEGLLRRIRTLVRGSRQLAGGDFGTRIADHGQDELSALSEDFNRLAAALERNDEQPMNGDSGRLRQVLDNLLGNSLRYTDSGGVTRVVARRSRAWIRVSVEDTAPGVKPEALERLFDRFYRVETSRSRAKGGAGLGLAICRNIVEAHHGSIQARATDAGGLAIDIRLPAFDG